MFLFDSSGKGSYLDNYKETVCNFYSTSKIKFPKPLSLNKFFYQIISGYTLTWFV